MLDTSLLRWYNDGVLWDNRSASDLVRAETEAPRRVNVAG